MKRDKVLITGGAGFIGNAIIDELVDTMDIVVLDNFSPQIHGKNYEESFLYRNAKCKSKVIYGDVRNYSDVEKSLEGVSYIIHLAAETGTGQSMYEINKYTDVNISGTSNLLQVILDKKLPIKKIILSSSRAVYGEGMYHCATDGVVFPKSRSLDDMKKFDFDCHCPLCGDRMELVRTNEEAKTIPNSFYAYTKLAQESILKLMCPVLDIPFTIFRYQNVYGVGQSLSNPYTGILSIFSKQLIANIDLNIFEDGLESRDFVNVKDVAFATVKALKTDETNNETINLGSGENTSVLEVANVLKEMYRTDSEIKVTKAFRMGDIRHNVGDISKAVKLLNYKPKYDFKLGMNEFTQWVKKENQNARLFPENESFKNSLNELKLSGMFYSGEEG